MPRPPLLPGSQLQLPLSRRGKGPGLLIFVPKTYTASALGSGQKTLDPEPIQKWAEEGFTVVQIAVDLEKPLDPENQWNMGAWLPRFFLSFPESCDFGQVGIICMFFLVALFDLIA
jgi:hypothetical protein